MNIKPNKEEVLKTGLGLFCYKGYKCLGVDEICNVTGITKGAFYNAFKSKEQFFNGSHFSIHKLHTNAYYNFIWVCLKCSQK